MEVRLTTVSHSFFFMILVSLCNRFLVSLTQDLEREMQLDLARQLEEINKEMDEQLLADLQVWWLFFIYLAELRTHFDWFLLNLCILMLGCKGLRSIEGQTHSWRRYSQVSALLLYETHRFHFSVGLYSLSLRRYLLTNAQFFIYL